MRHILTASGLIALIMHGHAQSDLCSGATLLTCGVTVTGNTGSPFTADTAPVCGVGNGTGGGVWYRITGTGQNITASLCASAFDTRIRVYTGGCSALTCVAGNDDFCGTRSQVTWNSITGTNYFILVHGFGSATGQFSLNITCAAVAPLCYTSTVTPYAADPFAGTPLTLTDDVHSALVPIGFPFCYGGITYTQCVISSNNYITFDAARANTFSPWATVTVAATVPPQTMNSILNPWQDIDPGIGGQIRYQTIGTAPYRRFVVSYDNVPMFSCNSQLYSSQTVLYESTNCIGSFITTKPVCTTWNSGRAVHALHNITGSQAIVIAGRNNTAWTAAAQGVFFTPTCAPCSTATTLQCIQMVLPMELIELRGQSTGDAVRLDWATASEQGTSVFIVERSTDAVHFEQAGALPAAGNSSSLRVYSLEDHDPHRGINYYRLTTFDQDGTMDRSEVIAVLHDPASTMLVRQDAITGEVLFNLDERTPLPARLSVHDMGGRAIRSITVHDRSGRLPDLGLSPGLYLLGAPQGSPAARFAVW